VCPKKTPLKEEIGYKVYNSSERDDVEGKNIEWIGSNA
jgi:hypothetical protein